MPEALATERPYRKNEQPRMECDDCIGQESQLLRDELKSAQRRVRDLEKAQRNPEDLNGMFLDEDANISGVDPSVLASISRDRDEAVEKLKGKDREISRLKELAKAESSRAEGAENEALVLVSELREVSIDTSLKCKAAIYSPLY